MSRAKTKLYASFLALAVIGFVVDRVLIGEPHGAEASQPEAAQATDRDGIDPGSLAPQAAIPEPFPTNLQGLDWSGPIRDPFLWPAELARRREQRLSGAQSGQSGVASRRRGEPLAVAQFMKVHSLSGVSVVGKSAMAIVDGRIVEVGQDVDHARLLTVEGNKAYFQCLDGVAVLSVDRRD